MGQQTSTEKTTAEAVERCAKIADAYANEKRRAAGNRQNPGQTYDMARATAAEEIAALIRATQ